jgi:phosphoserine phosphatase RsbU/P
VSTLIESTNPIVRALQYGLYDWTREMPLGSRILAWTGILIQGYAIYVAITRSLLWPVMWPPTRIYIYTGVLYIVGAWLLNSMLTSELIRKTRMESEQVAARAIQQTLQPDPAETIAGYAIEVCTRPFRNVGGDYLDFVTLPDGRAILAVADVSGKGMAAALLSANLQALVRTLAPMVPDPLELTMRINEHLWRYTPDDRYVTAVFIVLTPSTGEVTYVNAGHNPPIIWCDDTLTRLDPSGVPLGMFRRSAYEARDARIPAGGSLLLFTDGLTDSMRGDDPDRRLCDLCRAGSLRSIADIQALTDATITQDDLTIMLVRRTVTA